MSLTNEEYVMRLNESLEKKLVFLNEILSYTNEQSDAIAADDYDKINNIIDKKQESIDQANKLDDEFEIYFKRLKTNLNVKSLDDIKIIGISGAEKLKEMVEAVCTILSKIKEEEKENMEKTKVAFEKLKNIMNQMKVGKKANSAYLEKKSLEVESYFIDSKK